MTKSGILRSYSNTLTLSLRVVDLAFVWCAGLVAQWWIQGARDISLSQRNVLIFALIFALPLFERFGLYKPWRGVSLVTELKTLLAAWLAAWIAAGGLQYLTTATHHAPSEWLLASILIGGLAILLQRLGLRIVLRHIRSLGFNQRHIVLVGMGELGARVFSQLHQAPWAGLKVSGYFDDRSPQRLATDGRIRRLGRMDDLPGYLARHSVDQIWICLPLRAEARVRNLINSLRHEAVDIRFAFDLSGFNPLNYSMGELAGVPVLNISQTPLIGFSRLLKGIEDKTIALLALAALSPIMLLIACGIKLSSPGPVFYRQERVSWNNRVFSMLKFRSMPVGAEIDGSPRWTTQTDTRATGFGALLRRVSLDELPQLLNVLKGDMSIVGPRPERPHFIEQFKDQVPGYMKKHMVKAGITGWAQVNGWRGDTDLHKRIEFDLYYIENWSLWLDFKIIVMTLFRGLVHRNAY